jgi:hypothetical protein
LIEMSRVSQTPPFLGFPKSYVRTLEHEQHMASLMEVNNRSKPC